MHLAWRLSGLALGILKGGLRKKIIGLVKAGLRKIISKQQQIIKIMSFNVFAKARPIRNAFIFKESTAFDAACDGLATWSSEIWGGRRSVVVLMQDNGTLDEDAWTELVQFDPDYIYSFAPLPDALLSELDSKILPWLIMEKKQELGGKAATGPEQNPLHNQSQWFEESVQVPGVAVPPTERNLAQFPKRPFLLFEFGKDCPPLLRRFLNRNFGSYLQWLDPQTGKTHHQGWMENLLSKVTTERFQVNNLTSLCGYVTRISGKSHGPGWKPPIAFTAPCELTGVHLARNLSRGAFDHSYRVVVGSTLRDFLFYWRSCLNEGAGGWNAPFRHCLWIPTELIQEIEFVAALKNWFYCFTGQGNSGSRNVELTSVSLVRDELPSFADKLRAGQYHAPIRVVTAAEIESRWRNHRAEQSGRREFIPALNGNNSERLVAVERTQIWEIRPPEVIQDEVQGGVWAVDVQIEREPREGGLHGQDWWHLPRRSGRQLVASMFRGPARISRNGFFAVSVERNPVWPGTPSPPHLELRLPADEDVLYGLLSYPGEPSFDYSDARRERLKLQAVLKGMEISDAGRKLRGLIELFGGFWRAQDFWARSCWREIFCQMAGRGAHYDNNLRARIEAGVEKELNKISPPIQRDSTQNVARRIGQRVLNLVGERLPGMPKTFTEMEEIRAEIEKNELQAKTPKDVKYPAGDTLVHMGNVPPVTREELKQGLGELVELGVLRMCMDVRCPRCRMRHWIGIDNLRYTGICPGCGSAMSVIPETSWKYDLNPLVRQCVNSRALAVWQALAEVARNLGSFFFTPSAELFFDQAINGATKKEVDVLCVSDGKLLLGEVKEGTLHERDFHDFAAIAAEIRPDRAAMFVSEEQFDSSAKAWFNDFRVRLATLKINGEIFYLLNY